MATKPKQYKDNNGPVVRDGPEDVSAPCGEAAEEAMSFDGLSPPYATIVADPPWDHSDGTGKGYGLSNPRRKEITHFAYSVMDLDAIRAMCVRDIAAKDAHLYLWTTNRFLRASYDVAEAWGFAPVKPLVWCKSPHGFMGGAFGGGSIDFCLFARRGNLAHTNRAGRQWWHWPRGAHSVKPGGFMDIVEHVSPGPYVELFARQPRLGWDSWGYGVEGVA